MIDKVLFISHASEDGPAVQRIVDHLEREGITCWIAGRDIPPKAIYAEAITDAIKNAQACGVIVSRAANSSTAIKRELELASRYERPFIPIRIDDVEPGPGLDYYLNNVQWMEYRREGERALDRIVAHMKGQAYVPPSKPKNRTGIITLTVMLTSVAACIGVFALRPHVPSQATQAKPVSQAPSSLPTETAAAVPAQPTQSAPINTATETTPTVQTLPAMSGKSCEVKRIEWDRLGDVSRAILEAFRTSLPKDCAVLRAQADERLALIVKNEQAEVEKQQQENERLAARQKCEAEADKVVGDWRASTGTVVRFNADGTVEKNGEKAGTWKLNGGQVRQDSDSGPTIGSIRGQSYSGTAYYSGAYTNGFTDHNTVGPVRMTRICP